ncbi:MAG: transposase [Saprospiraceae bacterium]|nr:transposase [Saprospiraceae bacterium]
MEYWFHGNHEAAQEAVSKAIKNYNGIRPHESLGYKTPSEVHSAT